MLEIDGEHFFENVGLKKPMSIFKPIFENGGDLDYHFLDSRSSRKSGHFYTIMSVLRSNTVIIPNVFPPYFKSFLL